MTVAVEAGRAPSRVLVGCLYGVTGVAGALWGATIAANDARLDLGPARLGVILFVLGAGALVMMPVAGRLADRWTGRRVQQVSAPAYAVSLAGPGLAATYPQMIVAVALLSLALGALNVALTLQAADVERVSGNPFMATAHGVWALGAVAGGAAVGAAQRLGSDVRILMVAGGLALAVVYLLLGARLPVSPTPSRVVGDDTAVAPRLGLLLVLGVLGAAAFLTEGAATDWSGVHARRVLGADPATAAALYTVFFAAMTVVRFLGDRVRARLGPSRAIRRAGTVAAAGYALILLTPVVGRWGITLAVAGWALAGAGMSLVWPIISSTVAAAFGGRARRLSTVATVSYGGGLVGPAVIGTLASVTSLPAAMLLPAALAVLVAVAAPAVLTALTAG